VRRSVGCWNRCLGLDDTLGCSSCLHDLGHSFGVSAQRGWSCVVDHGQEKTRRKWCHRIHESTLLLSPAVTRHLPVPVRCRISTPHGTASQDLGESNSMHYQPHEHYRPEACGRLLPQAPVLREGDDTRTGGDTHAAKVGTRTAERAPSPHRQIRHPILPGQTLLTTPTTRNTNPLYACMPIAQGRTYETATKARSKSHSHAIPTRQREVHRRHHPLHRCHQKVRKTAWKHIERTAQPHCPHPRGRELMHQRKTRETDSLDYQTCT
jgi:hypothetical protein